MIGLLKEHRWAALSAVLAALWVCLPNALMRQQRRFYQSHFPEAFARWTDNGDYSTIDAFSTLADDNYYYAARIKQTVAGAQADPYAKGDDSPSVALDDWLTWRAYALVWRAIGEPRRAWMAAQFLFSLFWVPLLYALCLALGSQRGPALFLAVVSTLYADLARVLVAFHDFHLLQTLRAAFQYAFWFLGSYHYFLGPTRITGPLFTFPCLFTAALIFLRGDAKKSARWLIGGGVCGGLLAYVHADVFFAFMGAGTVYAAVLKKQRPAVMLAIALAVSAPWLIYCHPTREQMVLLGLIKGRTVMWGSFVFLAGALLCWHAFPREGLPLWCAGLLLSMFLACNTQLLTGEILAQGHWFFLGNTILFLVAGVWASKKLTRIGETDWRWLTALTFLVCLPRMVSYSALHYKVYALPAAEQQAYEWLDKNTPEGSVVAALSPQTDFRIAAHTHDFTVASFLFHLVSDVPLEENARRIIYSLSLYGVSLDDYLRLASDKSRGWEDALWSGEPDQQGRERNDQFRIHFCAMGKDAAVDLLRGASQKPVEDFHADYVWIGSFEKSLRPKSGARTKVFENSAATIYKIR